MKEYSRKESAKLFSEIRGNSRHTKSVKRFSEIEKKSRNATSVKRSSEIEKESRNIKPAKRFSETEKESRNTEPAKRFSAIEKESRITEPVKQSSETQKNGRGRFARLLLMFTALSLIIIALVVMAAGHLLAYLRTDDGKAVAEASGRHELDFRVFYLGNIIFPENPVAPNLNFLMSYTDYIEIDSSFNATFSEEMDIHYSYRAQKRFLIRPMGGYVDAFVFEEIITLSEASGEISASALDFGPENSDGPGGTYTIFPKEHIEEYLIFVEDQQRQMADENVIAQGMRGFSAELMIDFTYTISAPEFGMHKSMTYGYRLALTTEIYTFVTAGESYFAWVADSDLQDTVITMPMVILFVAVLAASLFGLLRTVRGLNASANKYKEEADAILKKYSNEIVIYDKPVDLTRHEMMAVQEFKELLKLAINLSKHIMCYRDETRTEFVVIVNGYACIYVINYDGTT